MGVSVYFHMYSYISKEDTSQKYWDFGQCGGIALASWWVGLEWASQVAQW